MDIKRLNGFNDVKDSVRASDYERCSAMEIIRTDDKDITELTSGGAKIEYMDFFGSLTELIEHADILKRAEKMIVYTLQDPQDFDEDELDRMARFFDTLTAGRTAYGLKMTGDYPAQFHIFMRIRED